MKKRWLVGLILVCFIFWLWMKNSRSQSGIRYYRGNDPRVLEAKKQAQTALSTFKSTISSGECNKTYDCMVKKDFVANATHEHMWVNVDAFDNGVFKGRLDDKPEFLTDLKYQQLIELSSDDVEDWLLYHRANKTFRGGYSIKLLAPDNKLKWVDDFTHAD